MFIHTLESLEEFEDYIENLEEKVGLTTETYQEVKKAISKERDKLKNLSLFGVSKSVTAKDLKCPKCKQHTLMKYIDGKECTSCGYVC